MWRLCWLSCPGWWHYRRGRGGRVLLHVLRVPRPGHVCGGFWPKIWWDLSFNIQGYCNSDAHVGTKLYNSYYQWVPVFFIVQVRLVLRWDRSECFLGRPFCFTYPGVSGSPRRVAWWHFSSPAVQVRSGIFPLDLRWTPSDMVVENTSEKQTSLLRNYCEHIHNKFNKYAFCFFFCELLNVTITVSQVLQ